MIGDFVKIRHPEIPGERFWVKITRESKELVYGRIDNDLLNSKYHYNDEIVFTRDHIVDLWSD